MPIVKVKPTSPGRRAVVKVVHPHLYKGRPEAALVEPQMQNAGRNNNGHITIRHKGGGHKHHYRVVDFVRNKDGIPAKGRAHRIRPEPHRAHRTRLLRRRRAPLRDRAARSRCRRDDRLGCRGADQGRQHLADPQHPVGSIIHAIEMLPGKGAQIARSAGTSATLLAREGVYAQVRLRSGEVRRIHIDCRATIGEVSNEEHSLRQYGKAGAKRWKGIRPTVALVSR